MKRFVIVVATLLLSACTINTGVGGEPADTTTGDSGASYNTMYDTLQAQWDTLGSDDQNDLCLLFNADTDTSYRTFNKGWLTAVPTDFPRDVYDDFFITNC